jgi:hypothetical protein
MTKIGGISDFISKNSGEAIMWTKWARPDFSSNKRGAAKQLQRDSYRFQGARSVVSGIFSTKQDAAAACTLPYHMESMFIFVSFRGISQAVSDDDRGTKSGRKNADGEKHMFVLKHNLYQIPR